MLRSQLYQLADDEHLLAITVHRIATDGWSFRVLGRELVEIYRADRAGPTVDLPALPVQYADFATWQRQRLRGERLTRLLSYWQQRLSGMSPLVLPGDRPRPAVASQRAGTVRFQVPVETVYGLHQLAQASEVTPYVLLLSAFAVLVQRYAGQKDITIGTPVHNRNVAGLEPLIGRFANTLVLRCDLAGDPTFRTLLARIRQVVLEAYDHQEMPFEQLVEAINPARDLRQNPLVQVVFQLTSAETTTWDLGSLVLHHVPMEAGTSEFDLRLVMVEDGQNLHGSLEYACDLYDPPTIERLAGHFQVLLAGILAHPEDRLSHLPLLTAGELQHVPQLGRGPAIPYPRNRCIHELFEAQVSRAPDATALVADTQTLTYAQLNRRANQLAHRLRARGVGIEDLVAVCLPRGVDLMVALLGILKAGAAYLPLDPRDPAERLEFMLRDAGAVLVLAQTAGEPNLAGAAVPVLALDTLGDEALPAEASNPVIAVTAENLANAMYTSGSTGRPKGVEICHRSVIRLLFGVDEAALGPDTVVVQLAPATFDAATFEIWGALLHGGRLVLAPDGPPDLAQLEALVIRRGVSTLWLTASLFNVVVDHRPALLTHVRQLLTGGEALSPRHVHQALQVLAPDACLVNGYGPTEGTTFTCCYQVPHDPTAESASIPIGRPIANTQVYVLDHHGQPLPVGVPGELCIGGDGLARGYRHRPELTAGCFVPNPFVDANHTTRLYRTGDQVRWLADGHLEFLGRLDHQVKVRGYRVELGEIEAALLRHPAVRAGAVVAEPEPAGGQRLVAHWVPGEGRAARAADLAAFLGTLLPAYMVPAQFVEHAALPLTAGGKLDRQALLAAAALPDATQSPAAPRTPLEQALAAIWAAVLPVAQVGIDDNFFALGGHSLRAVQVVARVRDQLGIDVPLRIIFEHPTVAGMAVQVQPLLDQAPPFEREEFVL
jgi:amino acid adenylation domain-containing protein